MATFDVSALIPYLRIRLGDTDPTSYRFVDLWLYQSLILASKALVHYTGYKYLIDSNNALYRNPGQLQKFSIDEPPVLEPGDENILVLMAAILILEGSLENSAWQNIGSWKDAEISFSNIESGRIRNDILKNLWDELNQLITPPTKRLSKSLKKSLPGYLGNFHEREGDF